MLTGLRLYLSLGVIAAIGLLLAWGLRLDHLRAGWQARYSAEQAAHQLTVANYRKAAAEAAAADLANARAVEGYYARISEEQSDDLRKKLDDARARAADYARRLRAAPETHPGSGNAADMSSAAEPTGGAAGAGQAAVMADDALICAENTVKAQGWQDWWAKVSAPTANAALSR